MQAYLKTFSPFGNRFKIMNKTNFIFLILILSFSSCKINRNYNHRNSIKCDFNSNICFNDKVRCFKTKSKNLVLQQLDKNGIRTKDCKIIYRTYVFIDDIGIDYLRSATFSQKIFLDSISFSTGYAQLILDKEGKYIAKSSDYFTYTDLENFKFYKYDIN